MASSRFALVTTVAFHDTVVETRHLVPGRPIVVGPDGAGLPLPPGVSRLALCAWDTFDRARVVDGLGREAVVTPGHEARFELGVVTLTVALAPQFPVRRMPRLDTLMSAAWLAIVLMGTNTMSAAYLAHENWCPWVGVNVPVIGLICTQGEGGGQEMAFTAEYIARLLQEDYAGDDEGTLIKEFDRPDAEKSTKDPNKYYLPAGNEGPKDQMGGAQDQAPKPVRTPEETEPPLPEKGTEQLAVDDGTTPLVPTADEEAGKDDGITDADDAPEDLDALDRPAEEVRGWGIRDWYDESDERVDNEEISEMLRLTRQILKIDPDDPTALMTLSYYQYLGQDYEGAANTYDRYIGLYPDSAAGYNNKALIYKRRGEYEQEERLYRVALALEPNDVTAMNNLAVCVAHQGRYEEALALMEALEVLDPNEPYAELHRSKIHAEMGSDDLAMAYLEKALEGMKKLDTLHHIEFRQDIRIDPSFAKLRGTRRFRDLLVRYYGDDTPLKEG